MPGIQCGACKKKKYGNPNLIFHRIPKDPVLRNEWLKVCTGKHDRPENIRVCSLHFKPDDYIRDLQNELLGLPSRMKLKYNAVPMPIRHQNEDSATDKQMMTANDEMITANELMNENAEKSYAIEILNPAAIDEAMGKNAQTEKISCGTQTSPLGKNAETEKNSCGTQTSQLDDYNNLKLRVDFLERQLKISQGKYADKVKENRQLKSQLRAEKNSESKLALIYELLSPVLTKNQLDLILKKKSKVKWTSEERSIAFTIRYFSKRCYLFLRKKMNYPLPGLSCLRRWASAVDIRSGIVKNILKVLESAAKLKKDYEKLVVLAFDEVKVKSTYEYDLKKDQILGPFSQLQVIMCRGLISDFKQPLFLDFDKKMTGQILNEVITKLYEVGYTVVACVSDCGGGNQGLWSELGIHIDTSVRNQAENSKKSKNQNKGNEKIAEKTYFKHPVIDQNVYLFADAPHVLKLTRNWLLDTGFILGDGTIIDKKPLQALLQMTGTEMNSCFKLTQEHLYIEKTKRQNVRKAAELLSHTTATALRRYKPGKNTTDALNCADFIDLTDKWYNIMNSYTKYGSSIFKNAYGVNLKEQNEILDKMSDTVLKMTCIGKSDEPLQVFQKGCLMSIKSLKGLFQQVTEQFPDVKYIKTYKLNQDCLENFFFQLRSRGGLDDHPTPLNALNRIRMIILGKNPGVTDAANTKDPGVEKYVTEALKMEEFDEEEGNSPEKKLEKSKELNSKTSMESASEKEINSTDIKNKKTTEQKLNEKSQGESSSIKIDDTLGETGGDAIEYISGYLSQKFKPKFPGLGEFTYKIEEEKRKEQEKTGKKKKLYIIASWVEQLSYGGLTKPTQEFFEKIKRLNKIYEEYHGSEFNRSNRIVTPLLQLPAVKEMDLPMEILKCFFKLRTKIRIKFLIRQMQNRKKEKRQKRKLEKQIRKKSKKQKQKKGKKLTPKIEKKEAEQKGNKKLSDLGSKRGKRRKELEKEVENVEKKKRKTRQEEGEDIKTNTSMDSRKRKLSDSRKNIGCQKYEQEENEENIPPFKLKKKVSEDNQRKIKNKYKKIIK